MNLPLTRILRFVMDFVLVPLLTWVLAMMAGFAWIDRPINEPSRIFWAAVLLAVVTAFGYVQGYQGYWKAGRKRYFLAVFVLPITIAAIGLIYGAIGP